MAGNRKKSSAAVRFGPALKAMLMCLLIGGAGVGYVGLKKQIHDLSQQISQREVSLKQLREQNAKLSRQLDTLRSPPSLYAKVNEMKLGLVPPAPSQIVRLIEPPAPPSADGLSSLPLDRVPLLAQRRETIQAAR
ncbi:MAG: hypothetical protein WCO56_17880 [Verrucomicrobiota bacterium]